MEFREEVRRAFVAVDDAAALGVFRAEAFIPAVDSDVEPVRRWLEALQRAEREPGARK